MAGACDRCGHRDLLWLKVPCTRSWHQGGMEGRTVLDGLRSPLVAVRKGMSWAYPSPTTGIKWPRSVARVSEGCESARYTGACWPLSEELDNLPSLA